MQSLKANQTSNGVTPNFPALHVIVRNKYSHAFLVWALYALIVIIMTWPVAAHLNSQLVGGHVDQWTHFWTYHWIKESFINDLLYTNAIFYPSGVSLATHNIAWLNILLWLPLQAVVGEIAAYNLVFLAILALNGLALFQLARELTKSQLAAFIGGLIFAVWPYPLSHHDHPNMIFVSWLPFALLFLKRALGKRRNVFEQNEAWFSVVSSGKPQGTHRSFFQIISAVCLKIRSRRDFWLAALFIILTSWARLHLLIMGSILIGVYALYQLAKNFNLHNLQGLALFVLISSLFSLPAAAPVLNNQLSSDNPDEIMIDQQETRQTDLLAYFSPSYYHPLWQQGPLADWIQLYPKPDRIIPRTPFLGYTTLFLVLSALLFKRRQSWFWGATAVLYVLIALGPTLRLNNQLYPDIFMPYRLIDDVYFIRLLRQPHRFNIILGIPLAILAAQGFQFWLKRFQNQRKMIAVTALITVAILFEYAAVPYPQTKYTTPDWFYQLATDPDDFAILNVPVGLFNFDKRHMFDQVTHGKPIVNGKVARVPREALAFLKSTPFIQAIFQGTLDSQELFISEQLRPLAEANVRYLVLHKDLLASVELATWQRWLSIPPLHEDEFLAVYSTEPHAGLDFDLAHPLTPELGLIQAQLLSSEASPLGLVQARMLWGSTAEPPANYEVCLYLRTQAGQNSQSYCTPIADGRPTSTWAANEIVHGEYAFQIDPSVLSGNYLVHLGLQSVGEETVVVEPITLDTINITPLKWPIQWEDLILLTDFKAQPTSNNLEFTFYWQALQEMDTSYKIFIHVYDTVTNELVAQVDTFPLGWTYLTNQWQVGEVIEDHIVLPVQNLSPGNYQLFIGFYEEQSNQRLSTNFSDQGVILTRFSR